MVDGNSVFASFAVGSSFTSVQCLISTQKMPIDCVLTIFYNHLVTNAILHVFCHSLLAGSNGSVLYTGLNPDRGRAYVLKITGTLPNGSTVSLNRDVHLGKVFSRILTCKIKVENIP